jgi:hypothetical protein
LSFAMAARHHLNCTKFFPAAKDASRRQGFFPTRNPSKLHNCKQYFWVYPDGSSTQAVYLNALEDSFREELIFEHYVSHMTEVMIQGDLGFNVMSRDEPWDFKVGLSTGATINVEICSFTDRKDFFQKLTAEELLQRHSYYSEIRFGILEKISKFFPSNELTKILSKLVDEGSDRSTMVSNPFYGEDKQLFMSWSPSAPLPILEEIKNAIVKKNSKKHLDKSQTVLILDNRTTTADLNDFVAAASKLEPLFQFSPFFEIWLYTGYGGGHNRKFEDFLLLPLKLDPNIFETYLMNRFQKQPK